MGPGTATSVAIVNGSPTKLNVEVPRRVLKRDKPEHRVREKDACGATGCIRKRYGQEIMPNPASSVLAAPKTLAKFP
jgi:hypothetical protein